MRYAGIFGLVPRLNTVPAKGQYRILAETRQMPTQKRQIPCRNPPKLMAAQRRQNLAETHSLPKKCQTLAENCQTSAQKRQKPCRNPPNSRTEAPESCRDTLPPKEVPKKLPSRSKINARAEAPESCRNPANTRTEAPESC